jgi:hypothetical protein
MLFGLFASMLLMIVMGKVLAVLFMPAVASVSANNMTGVFSIIAYIIILTNLMVSIAHRAYGLIHEVPDKVLRYIGAMQETLGEAGGEQTNRVVFAGAVGNVYKHAKSGGGDKPVGGKKK